MKKPSALAVTLIFLSLISSGGGCRQTETRPTDTAARLTGRAVLPADTFGPGPATGQALAGKDLLRKAPFEAVPVQGFSSLVPLPDGTFLALSDNGFGARANSADYPLRWYRLRLDLENPASGSGSVSVLEHVTLRDPDSLVPFLLTCPEQPRHLTGADFDPESLALMPDGTLWVGDEFGPFLLHFSPDGALLQAPVPVPVVPPLQEFARGLDHLSSPDNPTLGEAPPNLPGSGGLEGMALGPDPDHLYVSVEKALLDDPDQTRRTILEFDPATARFTGRFWFFQADRNDACVTTLEALGPGRFLLLERDSFEGDQAALKRVYQIDLNASPVTKTLVCDLLDLRDPDGFTWAEADAAEANPARKGAIGLGPRYSFPYVTTESLLVLDPETLLLVNDNNYPFSQGRRPGRPDDNEFIRLRLSKALQP